MRKESRREMIQWSPWQNKEGKISIIILLILIAPSIDV